MNSFAVSGIFLGYYLHTRAWAGLWKCFEKLKIIINMSPVPSTPCSSDTVYECPDYQTAGENSCFFNKNNTSIWVNYNITVVATNELGSTFSDSVDIDVVYIGEIPATFLFFGFFSVVRVVLHCVT